MTAQAMSPRELLDATAGWAPAAAGASAGPIRAFLESSGTAAMFLPMIDRFRAVLASEPADGTELARVTKQLGVADVDHDTQGRFIVGMLIAYSHSSDALIAERANDIVLEFFPDGLSFIKLSFAEEAGRAVARDALLTAANRALLAGFPIASSAGAATLEGELARLQALARALGELLRQRATLSSDGTLPSGQAVLDAKRELIRTVELLFQSWQALDGAGLLDGTAQNYSKALRDDWHQRATTATRNAAARRSGAPAVTPSPTPQTPPTPPSA